MPHLPQPARSHAPAVSRVVRRAAKSALPEVQAPDVKVAVRSATIAPETEMLASAAEN